MRNCSLAPFLRTFLVWGFAVYGFMACAFFRSHLEAQTFFIGGYGPGVFGSTLNAEGKMTEPKLLAEQGLPAFFAFHPKLDVLYVVTESSRNDPKNPSMVAAYSVKPSSDANSGLPTLTRINSQAIDGDASCHVAVDASGKFLAIANYSSGSVCLFPVGEKGSVQPVAMKIDQRGSEGPNTARQKESHAHCVVWDPSNRFLLCADLGLDKVFIYELDLVKGSIVPAKNASFSLAPGSGPRHLSFHPNGKWVYIINELNMTMTVAEWDGEQGKLSELQTLSTLPVDAKGDNFSTAEVLVHPSGRFVYGSNRGHHTIASFQVDESTGKLTPTGHTSTQGKTPRNFRLSPDGVFLLAENQDSNSIYSFRIDSKKGTLQPTGYSISAPAPACIKFLDR